MTESSTDVLNDAWKYMWPDITRGPAMPDWVSTMKRVASALDWEECGKCDGTGGMTRSDCCTRCYGIGKTSRE